MEAMHAVAPDVQDACRDAVEEPTIMTHDQRRALVGADRFFENAQGREVEVVGRLVEHEDVAADREELGEKHAVALAAAEVADAGAQHARRKQEALEVGFDTQRSSADGDRFAVAGDFFDDALVRVEFAARLI